MNQELLPIFLDEELALKYLINNEVILPTIKCSSCRSIMTIEYEEKIYRCSKKSCRRKISLFKNTIFEERISKSM